eukprot:TRINITY_DN25004_c0_g1_i1.p1 TRINITY_DN25004_c0_g1~~TRINITY_DN25004_c0_g1_i1.p1  ORF type:complete len:212 (-),score=10.62 TRINITY_DN25004_c0_g1_i1:214-849(-)
MLRAVFGPSLSTSGKAPSFNDFSLHVGEDAESSFEDMGQPTLAAPRAPEELRPKRTNVWQETFSPQMNSNMKHISRDFYDSPDPKQESSTVWEQIIKADTIRRVSFHHFDKNQDGFIDADDLRAELGPNAQVEQLIKMADKNGDGKIDQSEFCELLKGMQARVFVPPRMHPQGAVLLSDTPCSSPFRNFEPACIFVGSVRTYMLLPHTRAQ